MPREVDRARLRVEAPVGTAAQLDPGDRPGSRTAEAQAESPAPGPGGNPELDSDGLARRLDRERDRSGARRRAAYLDPLARCEPGAPRRVSEVETEPGAGG